MAKRQKLLKNKLKYYLRTGILHFGIPFLLWNCEIGHIETLEEQQSRIETVAVSEAIDFFNTKTTSDSAKSANKTYVIPHLSQISQEEIVNSDALLTVVPATTIYDTHYSRIVLLKINNEIQSIVFSMYASNDAAHEHFSGEIIITDIDGNFLNGYRVLNGEFVAQFRKNDMANTTPAKTFGAVCPDHGECVEGSNCIVCLQELEEVVVTGNSSNNGDPTPFMDLNDFPGIQEGGANGPDMGMGWDYGADGGSGNYNVDCNIANSLGISCEDLLAFEQDYKNRMSVSEKQLYENMSRIQQLSYLANAQFATWKAETLFPNWKDQYNGKGDAFRHAHWNAANVNDLGYSLTESLTTAHENKPPSYIYSDKEKQMDLFNNQVGRDRWNWPLNGYISLEESILDALNSGELRYLSNLHPVDNTATNSSQLTPTNQ